MPGVSCEFQNKRDKEYCQTVLISFIQPLKEYEKTGRKFLNNTPCCRTEIKA